jgi:hypothetical protein
MVLIRGTGSDKTKITTLLSVLGNVCKLLPYVIMWRSMAIENLLKGLAFQCQDRGWMISDLMMDWIQVVWNRRSGSSLSKHGMLVLDAFK